MAVAKDIAYMYGLLRDRVTSSALLTQCIDLCKHVFAVLTNHVIFMPLGTSDHVTKIDYKVYNNMYNAKRIPIHVLLWHPPSRTLSRYIRTETPPHADSYHLLHLQADGASDLPGFSLTAFPESLEVGVYTDVSDPVLPRLRLAVCVLRLPWTSTG